MEHSTKLKTTLAKPELPINLPQTAQWLAGEGAGSWFVIHQNDGNYNITRYSSDGKLECAGNFICQNTDFIYALPFQITYLSHCQLVTVIQDDKKIVFERK